MRFNYIQAGKYHDALMLMWNKDSQKDFLSYLEREFGIFQSIPYDQEDLYIIIS